MKKTTIVWGTVLLASSIAFANTVKANQPEGSWPLNEGDGAIVTDISGNKLDGQYFNIDKIEWVDGPQGKAPYFMNPDADLNGPRALASVPLPATVDLMQGFTLTVTVKTPKVLHRSRQYEIVNCSDTYSKGAGFRIYLSWRMFYFGLGNGEKSSVAHTLPANSPIRPDSWYTLTTTFDGKDARIYMDGVMVAEVNDVVFTPAKSKELRIGAGNVSGSGYGFEGIICSVALYSHSFSEAEVADLYSQE